MEDKKELISIRGQTIEVKELRWRDYLYAVKKLTDTALSLLGGKQVNLVALRKEGAIELDPQKIIDALTQQETLVGFIIEKTTGREQEWIQDLTAAEVLLILEKIVQLNLNEELLKQGKTLAGQMAAAFGLSKTVSPEPSTPSSAPATASKV